MNFQKLNCHCVIDLFFVQLNDMYLHVIFVFCSDEEGASYDAEDSAGMETLLFNTRTKLFYI